MLRILAKFLKVLNSETHPGQISLGFAFSMVAGLTPLLSLHNLVVLLFVLVLRVNLSAFLLGLALFSGIAYALDPIFHQLGFALLTHTALEGLWTTLYNSTLWRLEHFNNSIVLGSLVVSVVLFVPLVFFANYVIVRYREYVLAWVRTTRVMTALKATKFYRVYQTVSGWRGDL